MGLIVTDTKYEKNAELEEYKKRNKIIYTPTDEVAAKLVQRYKAKCSECKKEYLTLATNEIELAKELKNTGWLSGTGNREGEIFCPECIAKAL
jgi:predicted RNA-binding protein with PIN domain